METKCKREKETIANIVAKKGSMHGSIFSGIEKRKEKQLLLPAKESYRKVKGKK